MFDAVGAFAKQFTPVDGGYLYYPSRKSGGKLVTPEEYATLLAEWQRVAGTRGIWKTVCLAFVAILLWTFVSQALALPEWTDWILILVCVSALSGWLLWVSLAPNRLVKHRPDIVPPRSASQVRREVRAMLNWPFVAVALVASGAVLVGHLMAPEPTLSWWAWVIGSGLFFGSYLWIAFGKLTERQR